MGLHHLAPAGQTAHRLGLLERLPARRRRLGAATRVRGHRRRALGAAVAHLAQKRIDVTGCIGIDLLSQSTHGVERTEGVAIGQIFYTLVGPFVALTLKLDDIVLAVTR